MPSVGAAVRSRQHWLLFGGVASLIVIHLWSSAHVGDPTVVFDENGYLGNARWLAGGATWEMPFAPAYSIAYPLFLAPVMALFADPGSQWAGVRVVNAMLLASVFPLLFAVLHQVAGIPRRRAMAAAFVGAVIPATVAAGISGIAENLVLPLVPATVLTMWWMLDEQRSSRTRVLVGPATALLYTTHPRFTLAVPVIGLLLVWVGVRGTVRPAIASANGAGLAVGVACGMLLNTTVQSARWNDVEHLEGGIHTWIDLLTTTQGLRELALTATGQAWYLAAGSLGLSLVGVAFLARRGWVSRHLAAPGPSRSIVIGATLTIAATVFVTSVFFFAQNQFRPDHYVYGRHNDSFSPLWIGAAIAFLLGRGVHRRRVVLMACATSFILVSGIALASARDAEVIDDVFSPFAVPAIKRLVDGDQTSAIIRATLLSAIGSVIVFIVIAVLGAISNDRTARVGRAGFHIALGCWFGFMGLGAVYATSAFYDAVYDNWDPVPVLERIGVDELCMDDSTGLGRANLLYAWALPDVALRSTKEARDQGSECTFTIANIDDGRRQSAGDRLVLVDQTGVSPSGAPEEVGVWVAAGPSADRLERDGALMPIGFPGELPDSAQRTTISIEDTLREPVAISVGDPIDLDLTVTHTGAGSPWPNAAGYGVEGRVYVLARLRPLDRVGPDQIITAAAMPQWMWPGDTATATARIVAVDERLEPLPTGRYEVTLGVGQSGGTWFVEGGPEAVFQAEVRP